MKRSIPILLLALLCFLLLHEQALQAPRATPDALILVTSVADTTLADGACTLREAILVHINQRANADCPAGTGIGFNIPGTGVKKIVLSSPLPALQFLNTSATLIDGYTQPGSTPNTMSTREGDSNARLLIEVDGSNLPPNTPVFLWNAVNSDGSLLSLTIRGLIINHHPGPAIKGNCNLTVIGNFIGTTEDGEHRVGESETAIEIERPREFPVTCRVRIGSTTATDRNVIAGLLRVGYISSAADPLSSVIIENNLIGLSLAKLATEPLGGTIAFFLPEHSDSITVRQNYVAGGGIHLVGDVLDNVGSAFSDLTISENTITDSEVAIGVIALCPTISRTGSQISNNVIANSEVGISFTFSDGGSCGPNSGLALRNNQMDNTVQAINLGNEGVNAPDILDLDSGPNGLQNYPTIRAAQSDGKEIQIEGLLYSQAQGSYTLDFFGNRSCDLTTTLISEAELPIHTLSATTTAAGQSGAFLITPKLPLGVAGADLNSVSVMATGKQLATDTQLVSSEVSPCIPLRPLPLQITSVSPTTIVAGSSSTALAVKGGTFTANTTATLNGSLRTVTLQSATALAVTLPASDLANPATHTLQLRHPNGTRSNLMTIQVVSPTIGVSQVAPTEAILEPGMAGTLVLTWTHPTANWRVLDTLDLRLEDGDGPGIWLRFDEATGTSGDASTFSLLNPDGEVVGSGRAGEARLIEGESATLYLMDTRFQGSGPDPGDRSVTLTLRFAPKTPVAGRDFMLGVYLKDDGGTSEGPQIVGRWQIVWPHALYLPLAISE